MQADGINKKSMYSNQYNINIYKLGTGGRNKHKECSCDETNYTGMMCSVLSKCELCGEIKQAHQGAALAAE